MGVIPDPPLLKSLAVISPAEQKAGEKVTAETVKTAGAVKDADTPPNKASTSPPMVVIASGIPAMPKKLAQKVLNGEYINFMELPPAKGRARPTSLDWEGQVLLVQSADLYAAKKLIPDLATWVQCFSIYAAVLGSQYPDRIPDLLGYAAFIAKCSQKFKWPSWVVYDQNFRQQAADENITVWVRPDPGVYAQSFTNYALSAEGWCKHCHSVDHISETCPTRPKPTNPRKRGFAFPHPPTTKRPLIPSPLAPSIDETICRKYNRYDGDCHFGRECKFRHVCSNCKKGVHPAT